MSGREDCVGSAELMVKSVLESEGRGCQVAARAMYTLGVEEGTGRGRKSGYMLIGEEDFRRTFRRMENSRVFLLNWGRRGRRGRERKKERGCQGALG
jgi:hypothetical protein